MKGVFLELLDTAIAIMDGYRLRAFSIRYKRGISRKDSSWENRFGSLSMMVRSKWYRPRRDDADGRIVCELCPRECHLKPGDRGFCFVRENRDNKMVLSTYGRSTGFCIDPIEKKPLNHFYPGTSVLSFGDYRLQSGLSILPELEHLQIA